VLNAPRRHALVLVAALIGVTFTASLGAWQLSRASYKSALQSALDMRAQLPALTATDLARSADAAEAQHYRAVRLRGRWVTEHSVFLENRQMHGRVGFYLVTPMQLEGSHDAVLVQRGWMPRDLDDRTRLPSIPAAAGVIDIDGHVAPPPARLYEFSAVAGGAIRQNLDLGSFAAETGLRLAPLSVQQTDSPGAAGDGLSRQWPRPAAGVQKHYGYAFQWFALCASIAGLYVWFQLIRPRFKRHARD
jgi:surfeit locus 1 family protein